jgi:hypothetical protein
VSFHYAPGFLAVENGFNSPRTHGDVGRPDRPRLHEIARVVELGGNHGLAGAAEVRSSTPRPMIPKQGSLATDRTPSLRSPSLRRRVFLKAKRSIDTDRAISAGKKTSAEK